MIEYGRGYQDMMDIVDGVIKLKYLIHNYNLVFFLIKPIFTAS